MPFEILSMRKTAGNRRNQSSPVTSHQSPVTSHQSPVTSHQSPVTSHQSKGVCGDELEKSSFFPRSQVSLGNAYPILLGERRSKASPHCIPKQSLGTRKTLGPHILKLLSSILSVGTTSTLCCMPFIANAADYSATMASYRSSGPNWNYLYVRPLGNGALNCFTGFFTSSGLNPYASYGADNSCGGTLTESGDWYTFVVPDVASCNLTKVGATTPNTALDVSSLPTGTKVCGISNLRDADGPVCAVVTIEATDTTYYGITEASLTMIPNTASCVAPPVTSTPEPEEPSKPGLPPLPPTMTLNVDTSSLGLDYVDVYWGRNYPGSDSRIGSCKQDDTCTFTVETATWITLKPFAATGYQFKNQWGGSSSCSSGNPFMVNSVTCKPGFSKLPPEAPVVLSATGVSDSQIDLIWRDNSTRETGYIIERSNDQTAWIEIARTLADAITYSDLGLACDATYHYRVTAYNISGQSAPSNIGSAVIACPVPPPVTPPPVIDPVPPPVVPPTPPVTDPTPPTPPTEPTTPPGPETPPTEPPVTEPTELPTTPTEEPTVPVDETPVEPTTPPEPPVVPEPPVEPPVQPADSSDRPQGTETSIELPCPSDRHYNIHLDEACDAEGQTIENFKVVHGGSLANAIITGKLLNEGGLVSNLTLESTAVSEGGYVTNVMINKGLMKNFIFVGQQIKGGKLAGKIIIASKVLNEIRDVILVAGTVIQGKIGKEFAIAKLAGKIKGDAANPALLENVTIADGAELENVVLGEGVILGQNVKQKNVVMVCTTQRANGKGFNSGGFPFDDDQTCFAAQENAVALTLNPDSDLIGQTAEQLFVVIHGQKAFMFTHEWQEWNGELAGLDSAQSLTINSIQTIAFPELSSFEGEFKFFVGLRLKKDGTVVYHQVR